MIKLTILILSILSCFCACGRKQRNIFLFDNQDIPRANKLTLPAVKGVKVREKSHGALVTWFPLDIPSTCAATNPYYCDKCFAGYNVYRLTRTNIIPRHPQNKRPIKATEFFDKKIPLNKKNLYYLVRAVFICNKTPVEGPVSLIVKYGEREN